MHIPTHCSASHAERQCSELAVRWFWWIPSHPIHGEPWLNGSCREHAYLYDDLDEVPESEIIVIDVMDS